MANKTVQFIDTDIYYKTIKEQAEELDLAKQEIEVLKLENQRLRNALKATRVLVVENTFIKTENTQLMTNVANLQTEVARDKKYMEAYKELDHINTKLFLYGKKH